MASGYSCKACPNRLIWLIVPGWCNSRKVCTKKVILLVHPFLVEWSKSGALAIWTDGANILQLLLSTIRMATSRFRVIRGAEVCSLPTANSWVVLFHAAAREIRWGSSDYGLWVS